MTQTISRVYQDRENAEAAAAALKKAGFGDQAINLIAPSDVPDEDLAARIRQGGVVATHAGVFAEAIRRGETLVSVQAQFGSGAEATRILQRHRPTDTGLPEQGYIEAAPEAAAPLSSALGLPVLLHDPTPLSSVLMLPVLTASRPSRRPDAELVDDPAPLSKLIGQPVLVDRPSVLSSLFGLRVLWDNSAPLSARLGLPVLTKGRKPPSDRSGAGLRPDKPAPLSSLFGLTLLSNDPAPLSRLFGLRVLSDDPKK